LVKSRFSNYQHANGSKVAPSSWDRVANLERDSALGAAIPSSPNCIPSTQLAVLQADQREVHAVVVDMPQRASLEYASPDTWATLPNFDPPDEESPKPVLQVALN
jgi:hypothetical protein